MRDIVIADKRTRRSTRDLARERLFCGTEKMVRAVRIFKGLDDFQTPRRPADLWSNGPSIRRHVDTVTRTSRASTKAPAHRWIFAWRYNGLMPHDAHMMKTIETIWKTGGNLPPSLQPHTNRASPQQKKKFALPSASRSRRVPRGPRGGPAASPLYHRPGYGCPPNLLTTPSTTSSKCPNQPCDTYLTTLPRSTRDGAMRRRDSQP